MANVVHVVLQVLVNQTNAVGAELPESSDAGLDGKSLALHSGVLIDDERHFRSWTDQRHLAQQHIDQLRELVHTGATQQAPEWRDAWVFAFARRVAVLRNIPIHGAKLEYGCLL